MTDDRRQIDLLLERVDDAALREQLRRAVDTIAEEQALGLVFEDHLPEAVRLPKSPVRRGVTVQYVDGNDDTIWEVRRVRQGKAFLGRALADGTTEKRDEVPVDELVVARRLGDPVYPGLTPLGTIERGGDKPHHLVIEGENFHALQTLQYTHAGKVDLIYIDPPYNTGAGDWIYNDKYVGEKDAFRHSKWLSFMKRRLDLARDLLAQTGVVIVAIGDHEHHRLRMLMDQVFGERNFISSVVWQGGRKNDSRFVSNGADYMLIYGRDVEALTVTGTRWREKKPGVDVALEEAAKIWEECAGDHVAATKKWRVFLKNLASRPDVTDAVSRYTSLDDAGRPIYTGQNISWPGGGGPRYDVLHPVTGKPVKVPSRGWIYKDPEKLQTLIREGRARFGADETAGLQGVSFLDELDTQVASSVFEQDRRVATKRLRGVLGANDFPNPKDVDVIARWIGIATTSNRDAVVLDFFAGTGTTAEAVMRLNAADGGRRQAIVVTNNELAVKTATKLTKAGVDRGSDEWEAEGVFQKVTRPRIETVVTGIRRDGSVYSDGLQENVAFLKLEYLDRDDVEAGAAFRQVAELLWAKAGAVGPVIAEKQDAFAMTDHYAVCFDSDRFTAFVEAVNASPTVQTAFIVAPSEVTYGTVKRALRDDIATVHLYENYLSNFEINTGAGR